jgi:hypothetical protein
MLAQERDDLAPLLGGNCAILNDTPDQAVRRLATALQQENHRQRHFAFA